jgi:orotate phosphoribosyltransferase
MMEPYKQRFIEFMVRSGVLTFGDFTTKSGRKTPFFINTGKYRTGSQMQQLGLFYADAIHGRWGAEFDVLFGPAYKGIPLAVAAAIGLHAQYSKDTAVCFNRKEAKDHGEGGSLIGHPLKDGDRVLIIEDVTTAGTSIRETVPLLQAAARISLAGLIVSVDRMEKGTGDRSALQEVAADFAMPTAAIVTIDEIVTHLRTTPVDGALIIDRALLMRIDAYRAHYGA